MPHEPAANDAAPALLAAAEAALHDRQRRAAAFEMEASLFGDVAWALLLRLLIDQLTGRVSTPASLCRSVEVAVPVGVRLLRHLRQRGMVDRGSLGSMDLALVVLTIRGRALMERALLD